MQGTKSARRVSALATVALLLVAVGACGSSGSSGSAATPDASSTTVAETTSTASAGGNDTASSDGTGQGRTTTAPGSSASSSTRPGTPGSGDPGSNEGDVGPGGGGPCSPDPDRLSGTSTVMWTADSASEHTESEATAKTTLLFQMNGSMRPSTLTVKVGEVFTFGLADGVSDIVSVKVGCDSGQTVLAGDPLAAEYITTAGTYDIVNIVTNQQVGTITVK